MGISHHAVHLSFPLVTMRPLARHFVSTLLEARLTSDVRLDSERMSRAPREILAR